MTFEIGGHSVSLANVDCLLPTLNQSPTFTSYQGQAECDPVIDMTQKGLRSNGFLQLRPFFRCRHLGHGWRCPRQLSLAFLSIVIRYACSDASHPCLTASALLQQSIVSQVNKTVYRRYGGSLCRGMTIEQSR